MASEQKKVRKKGFFKRLFKSPIFNGVLSALPFGKLITNVKEAVSKEENYKSKNYIYLASYIFTGVLMWLFVTGKIDKEKLEYLFGFVQQLIN
jgi:hypothetical protein